jgi:hypothetical protein
MLDFIGGWKVAAFVRRAADHAERSPIERMSRIQNLDYLDQ